MALSLGLIFLASISSAVSAPAPSSSIPSCEASMDDKLPSITPTDFHFSGNVRRYYVAAEEIVWDYAPSGWDNTMGVPVEVSPKAKDSGYNTYGTKWKKAVYRGYTDATFTEKAVQSAYQGLQGPTLRSEVGDMVEILFVNNLRLNWASMHSMGLSYTKTNEGSLYPNGSRTVTPGDAVPPGGCAVYKWVVPESAAPPKGEPAKMHGYHSYISMYQDINAGLAGPQVVYQRGMMERTMADYTEVPLFFMGIEESASILASENAQWLANSTITSNITATLKQFSAYGNTSYELPQMINILTAEGFEEAPDFYTINGYTLANSPPFNYGLNEKVIYYFYAHGTESHTFHMHGHGFTSNGLQMDALDINDGEMSTLYMTATTPGVWMMLCHVGDHISVGGMAAYYTVSDNKSPNSNLAVNFGLHL